MPNYARQVDPSNLEFQTGLKGLYDKVMDFYNQNQNDIDAILTATDVAPFLKLGKISMSAMPMIAGMGKRRELYKKLLGGLDLAEPISLVRMQKEPSSDFISHVSRGGIFTAPEKRISDAAGLVPLEAKGDSLHQVNKAVQLKNPLVIRSNLVGQKFSEKEVKPKTLRKLLALAMKNVEGSYQQNPTIREGIAKRVILPDLIASYLAKRAGFDSIIPVADKHIRNRLGEQPFEIMLMPEKKVVDRIIR